MQSLQPLVDEFQVNSDLTLDNQDDPNVASLPDGGFVVVFEAWDVAIQTNRVMMQRYDADGSPVGDEVIVSPPMDADQEHNNPDVAVLEDGSWVVVWNTYADNPPIYDTAITAQIYAPDGTPDGAIFEVSPVSTGEQFDQKVVASPDGGFVVVWRQYEPDFSASSVYMRLYDDKGDALTPETLVSDGIAGSNRIPAAAFLEDGSFVVTWATKEPVGGEEEFTSYIRSYNADGTPKISAFSNADNLGQPIQVFDDIDNMLIWDIAPLGGGNFAVVGNAQKENGDFEIVVQVLDEHGQPQSDVATATDPDLFVYGPSVTATPDGGFFVSGNIYDAGNGKTDTYIQRFDSTGTPVGDPVQVNNLSEASTNQDDADLATLADGSLVVVWEGDQAQGNDVYAEIYGPQWYGTDDNDVVKGSGAAEYFEMRSSGDQIKAKGGADTVYGGKGNDRIKGQNGNDELFGEKGLDKIFGGNGKDRIIGGASDDLLSGGADADKFIFESIDDGEDRITDFELGIDLIHLKALDIEFGDLTIKKTDGGASAKIIYEDLKITLEGVDFTQITQDDFLF